MFGYWRMISHTDIGVCKKVWNLLAQKYGEKKVPPLMISDQIRPNLHTNPNMQQKLCANFAFYKVVIEPHKTNISACLRKFGREMFSIACSDLYYPA